ncbi:MAG: FxLYD domain-containing protein [Desulfarculaceae bacterium]|nr:FxLYD domain-containing protein [Desulfarculaceae bacterium]MCF8123873.1 FxLYD domain-containing protein [Desulfarculaceae bacterium]
MVNPKAYAYPAVICLLLFIAACASSASSTYTKAQEALGNQKWDEAITHLTKLKTTIPYNPSDLAIIHTGLGWAWLAKGNEDKGEENIILAIKYAPYNYAEPYFFKGGIYLKKARTEEDLGRKKHYLTEAIYNFKQFDQKFPGTPPCPEDMNELNTKALYEANNLLEEVSTQTKRETARKKEEEERARKERLRPKYTVVALSKNRPKGHGNYKKKANNYYYGGDKIYVYFEPGALSQQNKETTYIRLELVDASGTQAWGDWIEPPANKSYGFATTKLPTGYGKLTPGKYDLILTNELLGSQKIPIVIKSGESPEAKKKRLAAIALAKKKKEAAAMKAAEQERAIARQGYELLIKSWRWSQTSSYYVEVTGEVKNISYKRMKNVVAVASFYDKQNNFITSKWTFLEFNPVMPGQTSPFKIMARFNPLMNKCSLRFKYFTGQEISAYRLKR